MTLTAREARLITDNYHKDEIGEVVDEIREKAQEGENVLYVYRSLQDKTKAELKYLGYRVIPHGMFEIKRDKLFYSIEW